jgi:hypothetical protein
LGQLDLLLHPAVYKTRGFRSKRELLVFRQEEEPSCKRYSVLKSIRWMRPEQNEQVAQFDLLNHNPNDQRGL